MRMSGHMNAYSSMSNTLPIGVTTMGLMNPVGSVGVGGPLTAMGGVGSMGMGAMGMGAMGAMGAGAIGMGRMGAMGMGMGGPVGMPLVRGAVLDGAW